jgi:hypothetical protein
VRFADGRFGHLVTAGTAALVGLVGAGATLAVLGATAGAGAVTIPGSRESGGGLVLDLADPAQVRDARVFAPSPGNGAPIDVIGTNTSDGAAVVDDASTVLPRIDLPAGCPAGSFAVTATRLAAPRVTLPPAGAAPVGTFWLAFVPQAGDQRACFGAELVFEWPGEPAPGPAIPSQGPLPTPTGTGPEDGTAPGPPADGGPAAVPTGATDATTAPAAGGTSATSAPTGGTTAPTGTTGTSPGSDAPGDDGRDDPGPSTRPPTRTPTGTATTIATMTTTMTATTSSDAGTPTDDDGDRGDADGNREDNGNGRGGRGHGPGPHDAWALPD